MPVRRESSLVGFDAERALSDVLAEAGDDLLSCVAYTTEEFEVLYVADDLLEKYGGVEELTETSEEVHEYLHLDLAEQSLFQDLFPTVTEAYAFVTYTDMAAMVRVVTAEEGLYLSLRPGSAVTPAVEAARGVVREG